MATEALSHRNFIDIYQDFADTPYGADLASNLRYAKYNLSHASPEQWQEMLGPDVNNLEHMRVTYQLTQAFVRHSQSHQPDLLNRTDEALLLVAAISHDQGEALIGDISFGDKTADDAALEQQQFTARASEFAPSASSLLHGFLARARDEIIFDHSSRLGRVFNAIERVGYLRTALRASQLLQESAASDTAAGLRWLMADVLSNQTEALLGYAHDYTAIDAYLQGHAPAIGTAFALVSDKDFEHYGEQRGLKLSQFTAAKQAWQSFAP